MIDVKDKTAILDELSRCSRCGLCQSVCPTYRAAGIETSVARGRNVILRAVLEGRLEAEKGSQDAISSCLLCRACVTACPAAIQTDILMLAGRHEVDAPKKSVGLFDFIFKKILPDKDRLSFVFKLLSIGKGSGISGISAKTGILKAVSPYLDHAEGLVGDIPRISLRERINGTLFRPDNAKGKVAYFIGCGVNHLLPDIGLATLGLLDKSGFEVIVPETICCGLPPYSYGDLDTTRLYAWRNINRLNDLDCDTIVTDCGSCSSFLKEYPLLFQDDKKRLSDAIRVSNKVMDITAFIPIMDEEGLPEINGKVITWHDPCHLGRFQGITEEPRRLIKGIKGVEFREMQEADLCCGGAGTYSIRHNDLSMKILDRKVDNIVKSGADIVATACPSCIIQLNYGLKKNKLPVKAVHITQILNKAG
ncbi:MAG: (Fe-S)-binding protein [Nitrospirota bacterium]